jgi:hypothetical protein
MFVCAIFEMVVVLWQSDRWQSVQRVYVYVLTNHSFGVNHQLEPSIGLGF